MGNLSSIYHKRFDKLVVLTNSHNKAVFLDKCLFWWQISKYTLDDGKIWFTRLMTDIAKETAMSTRTISRYLDELEQRGFIERVCKLSASNKNNAFKVTKRLYIRVTEKLLNLLQLDSKKDKALLKTNEICSSLNQHDKIDKDNLTESIYKEKDHNQVINSTVSHAGNVNNFEKTNDLLVLETKEANNPIFPIEGQIGERLTERFKNYIKGMLVNLQQQHNLYFSDPNKLFAEVVFSVTQDAQWPGIPHPHHRVNIVAKLLRTKQWRTPKGFYNHWDIGQLFRRKEEQKFEKEQILKMNGQIANCMSDKSVSMQTQARRFEQRKTDEYRFSKTKRYEQDIELRKLLKSLQEINESIQSESSYVRQLQEWYALKIPSATQSLIDSVLAKLANLYEEKNRLGMLTKGDTDYTA